MLLATDSEYRLSKEDICQTLWKRDTKDGQALYNTTVSGLRKLFIADDESIELKTLPKEERKDKMIKKAVYGECTAFFRMYYQCLANTSIIHKSRSTSRRFLISVHKAPFTNKNSKNYLRVNVIRE